MERPEKKDKTLPEKLFDDRILFLGAVNDEVSMVLNMQLLYLESLDPKKDIFLYINSPGGGVQAGLAIYDTINFINCDVWTICLGMAASMGAFLLSGGTKGKRICLPNSKVMIHQPLRGFGTETYQATEIQIAAKEIMRVRQQLNEILSERTNQQIERINTDTERDYWMTSQEALEYGIVDIVAKNREELSLFIKKHKTGRLK